MNGCGNPRCTYSTCVNARVQKLAALDDMAKVIKRALSLPGNRISDSWIDAARAALAKAGL
jgi:hypothetical protein